MQVVILAGGTGTRLKEVSGLTPKALVPIGGIPMIVHIMRRYARYGHTNFILALGYRQEDFKYYFTNYDLINNDITVDIGRGISRAECRQDHGWSVTMVNTGLDTLKAARLKQVEKYIRGDFFGCTYGDGIGDVDIDAVVDFHKNHGKLATVVGVHPQSKFGEIKCNKKGTITYYGEKLRDPCCVVNGGFMVFNRDIFDWIPEKRQDDLEGEVFHQLIAGKELMVYIHEGYWQCMDTPRELGEMEAEWATGKARWMR